MANCHESDPEVNDCNEKSLTKSIWSEDIDQSIDVEMWGFVPWSRFGFPGRGILADTKDWQPRVDVFQREGNIVVQADLPGLNIGDIEVSAEQNRLIIRGHRQKSRR